MYGIYTAYCILTDIIIGGAGEGREQEGRLKFLTRDNGAVKGRHLHKLVHEFDLIKKKIKSGR